MTRPRPIDHLGLGAALLAVSFSAILIRLCESEPEKIAWYRLLGAGSLLLIWLLVKGKPVALPRKDFIRALAAGVFLAAHFYLWISSLFMTTIHSSVVLLATQPLFALIFQRIFRSVPIGPRQMLSLTGGLIGAMILAGGDFLRGELAGQGDVFAIISAAMAAAYLFTGERRESPLIPYLTTVYLAAGLMLFALTLARGETVVPAAPQDYLWFTLLVLGPTLVGHSLLNYSTRIFSTYTVNLSILFEPLLTGVWAWLIFREPVTANVVAGGILILVSLLVEFYPRAASRARVTPRRDGRSRRRENFPSSRPPQDDLSGQD